MDFLYEPMTEEAAQNERYSLLREGNYQATIRAYEQKTSAAGNLMVVWNLDVYDEEGRPHQLDDYMVITPKMAWKHRHHCEATSALKEYEERKWHPDMSIGKNIIVSIGIDKGKAIPFEKLKGKPEGSCYSDKNGVRDYLPPNENKVVQMASGFDDPIPF